MSRTRCDDDGWWSPGIIGVGQAHSTGGEEVGEVVGRLLVPDPEQRHGWREFYVRRPLPERRLIGFQRPGSRR